MAAIAASPAPAVSPKAALLAGAAPEVTQSAPTLDAMFARLLSKGTATSPSASDPSSFATGKPQTAKKKTDPANAALMALLQGQAAAPPAVTPAQAASEASAPSVAASKGASRAKAQTPAIRPVAQAADDKSAKDAAAAGITDPSVPAKAQGGKNTTAATDTGKPSSAATRNAANGKTDPLAALKDAGTKDAAKSEAASTTQRTAATDTDATANDPKKTRSPDLQSLLSARSHRTAPDKQDMQAKALPVRFDQASGKPDAKTDAQAADNAISSGKDERTADAKPQTSERSTASMPQTRSDAQAQNTHSANQPESTASTQSQTSGQGASAVSSNASATASVAASATAQSSSAQNSAPALQVVPQAQAAVVAPDLSALAVSIAAKSKDGEKHFDIRLDPPDLGRVDVRLSVDPSGKAQAHLIADKPQTLDLLQRDRSDLERSLKDAGLALSNNGLNFSLKGQERQSDSAPAPRGGSALGLAAVANDEAAPIPATNIHGLSMSRSRLDIRV